ncbi:MAG: sigma-70 family RNA polymerase sigma factor [Clostridium sp.]
MIIDDTNYIHQLKKSNTDALDYVIKNYGNLIFRVCYKYLNNRELSEECLNDVIFKIWVNANNFSHSDEKFKSWICSIAKFTAIDMIRKESKINSISIDDNETVINDVSGGNDTLDLVISKENYSDFLLKLSFLREIDRQIIIQRFYLQKSLKEIGLLYNLDPKTVFTKISRAREKLK